MKKLLALIICLMMALAVAACGSDDGKSAENKSGSVQTQREEKSVAEAEENKAEEPLDSAEVLAEIVDEFNNTDDPEVKEQLRQRLEEIFAQAEAASNGVIQD